MPGPHSLASSDRLAQLEATVREQARKLADVSQDLQGIADATQHDHFPMFRIAGCDGARQLAQDALKRMASLRESSRCCKTPSASTRTPSH